MLILTILILSLLALANYLFVERLLFYPPVVFCALWALDLVLLWLAGNSFYPLSPETLVIFASGGFAFSIGSWCALLWPQKEPTKIHAPGKSSDRALNLLAMLMLIAVPFCYRWIVSFSSEYGSNLFLAARLAMLDQANEFDAGSILFGNIVGLANVGAMILFFESTGGKYRSTVAIVSAFVLNLLTGGRAGMVGLVFGLIWLDWLKNRRLRWKPLVAISLLFVVSFSLIAVYVQKGEARADAPLSQNVIPVVDGFVLYAAGGLVAFDRVVRDPDIVPHNWHINRFFLQTLNKFGARFEIPPLAAEYVSIGPNSSHQNVYTFYFAYLDFGYFGMMVIVFVIGVIITIFYKRAMSGGKVAALMSAGLFASMLVTIFNESLFLGLNYLLKLMIVSWIFYSLPSFWIRITSGASRVIKKDLVAHRVNLS